MLLVDDDEDGRQLLAEHLSRGGFAIVGCGSGEEALAIVSERGSPSVVVTDLSLAEMSGADLARKLRKAPATADIPILALTGYSQYHDPDGLFATVLVKPVVLGDLMTALNRVLEPAAVRWR